MELDGLCTGSRRCMGWVFPLSRVGVLGCVRGDAAGSRPRHRIPQVGRPTIRACWPKYISRLARGRVEHNQLLCSEVES